MTHSPKDELNAHKDELNDGAIDDLYPMLLGFAVSQLNNHALAEDVVQDAWLLAVSHQDKFVGKSAFKTWVFAILKNKIIDVIRGQKQMLSLSDMSDDGDQVMIATLFNQKGAWHGDVDVADLSSWRCDDDSESAEFWQVLELCLSHLPPLYARIFLMKECIGFEADEICKTCAISPSNFYTTMHRTRLRLQQCLQTHWFDV
ncbi:sigma-70 family RNA polymerase sigma factor [Moraxella nasovis]|uniref:sigma-70 family RNA polymerase sigma factor n=1 Tax=Moraxella nasovis TaxID=2904121 RepID=UPI001F611494|nr:sigma-70 family RNA polymerase sigma factor [Moraxella nasovis]UNU73989.1 sigma-70 family RNA polymerase sigma factor [Moraxella nasovis]